ncbi:unnamed protein product [Pleuronectes platessa]|uniref:Uncharacterized protein n=1 Tax=Pleuronectes platessa TaxID=8262 RepID=A0A9N7U0S6_PLEPL|nr:unnamed protein product [Pleuronectes platessa]
MDGAGILISQTAKTIQYHRVQHDAPCTYVNNHCSGCNLNHNTTRPVLSNDVIEHWKAPAPHLQTGVLCACGSAEYLDGPPIQLKGHHVFEYARSHQRGGRSSCPLRQRRNTIARMPHPDLVLERY